MIFRNALETNRGKRLMIGGHRGHLSDVRENTIENYAQILGSGISHVELDIQMTHDDVAVIYHDMDLGERSPLSGRIRDYTVRELKDAFRIDTLDETVAWCSSHKQAVAFELKSRAMDMYRYMPLVAEQLVDTVNKYNFTDMCFAFSKDYRSLEMIRGRCPDLMLGLIVPVIPSDPVAFMRDAGADIYLSFIDNLCPEIISELHNAGYYVDGSVINTPEMLKLAVDFGVDLIESDYPIKMMKKYEELKGDC